jgi:hypothetical protein
MIQVTRLPLSSPEVARLRKWFHADEANRALDVVNAELTTLEADLANAVANSTIFPNYAVEAEDKFNQIKVLKNFLATFNRLAKNTEFDTIRLEIKHE